MQHGQAGRWSRAIALVTAIAALAACGGPAPSTGDPPRPTAQPGSAELAGTYWESTLVQGQVPPAGVEPWIEIYPGGLSAGAGSCGPFGAHASFERGVVGIVFDGDFVPCPGRDADARRAFLEMLAHATSYVVEGDAMLIWGSAGEIRFRRPVPPPGDPARAILDRIRAHEWRVLRATVAVDVEVIPAIGFTDRGVFANHDCGFSGNWRLSGRDTIQFRELDWSIDVCADPGGRERLVSVLKGATTVGFVDAETLVINGRTGEIVLGP